MISVSIHELTRHRSTGGIEIHPVSQYDHKGVPSNKRDKLMKTMIFTPARMND